MLDQKTRLLVEEVQLIPEDKLEYLQSLLAIEPWKPKHLVADRLWQITWNAYDSFLCIVSIVLIVKTSLCVVAYRRDGLESGSNIDSISFLTIFLIQFNEQLVTAFTIVFVTIISTVTHRYALYRAQKGGYLIDIEQLHGSVSLPSTIAMVFSLRKFTRFSAILVAVWSFYYLGSQAVKREYVYAISPPYRTVHAAYPSEQMVSYFNQEIAETENFRSLLEGTNSLVSASEQYRASIANNKQGIDIQGRFLIPDIKGYERAKLLNFRQTEIPIKPSVFKGYYSASAGKPLVVETDELNQSWEETPVVGSFNMETSYFSVRCQDPVLLAYERFPPGLSPDKTISLNLSIAEDSPSLSTFHFWIRWNATYGRARTDDLADSGSVRLPCNVTNTYVEIHLGCAENGCLVTRIREIAADPALLLRTPFVNAAWASRFFDNLVLTTGALTEVSYLYSPLRPLSSVQGWLLTFASDPSIWKPYLRPKLERGLTEAFNNYYNLALNATYPVGRGFSRFGFEGSYYYPNYHINWYWLAIDYFSGFLLLVASIFSGWLHKRTLAPDIFGYVSSLTRDNPHMPLLEGGSALSGLDRTRHLCKLKIKITDVHEQNESAGKVGLIVAGGSQVVEGLRRDRKYI